MGLGALPASPVRYSDQGSSLDAYNASACGRTWNTIALRLSFSASFTRLRSSSRAACVDSPGLLGQSMLSTVAIHAARSSLGNAGGASAAATACASPLTSSALS